MLLGCVATNTGVGVGLSRVILGGKISVQLSQPEFRAQYTHSSANQQSAQTCNAFHRTYPPGLLKLSTYFTKYSI